MAPPPPPPSLDYWRGFFSGARASIFDSIDAAIRLAAADHPDALRARRDAIAERLYTALIALPPPEAPWLPTTGQPAPSLCSSDRAEVVTDDGGAAPRNHSDDAVVAEAFRVKAALSNAQEKSETELLELLQKLRQLEFTVEAIMATEIGKAVKPLRKHASKQIRQLVRSLIEGWKAKVNEWVNDGGPIVGKECKINVLFTAQFLFCSWSIWSLLKQFTDHTPQSVDASCLDQEEGGLPSPPMDEAALFATPCTSIQLSEFFDEMDDDGNIRSDANEHRQCNKPNQESIKKSPMGQWYDPEQNWKLDPSSVKQSQPNEPFNWQTKQQSNPGAQGKPSSAAFGPGRPQMMHSETQGSEMRPKQQEQDVSVAQRRLKPTMPKPSPRHDDNSVRAKLELAKEAKLEATKRKLQEGYQEFNNAKKQRTVLMVDPQDLPKQGSQNPALSGKARNSNTNIRNRLGIRR
ncbi:probable mediator of RNA polymerase II transcription subunit 26b isoform X2 [Panicum virgatum]|uniref:probable mediator of RNA polymerase II transcription subunit 26b isoform X2 n=1 Tax=Panicum virgatum TaxID=38727 RepID=UPI0019D5EC64|nr:probable mediator of RNA polymerase II transcription subunit 26b isoform X2 [Panicum virgatum]